MSVALLHWWYFLLDFLVAVFTCCVSPRSFRITSVVSWPYWTSCLLFCPFALACTYRISHLLSLSSHPYCLVLALLLGPSLYSGFCCLWVRSGLFRCLSAYRCQLVFPSAETSLRLAVLACLWYSARQYLRYLPSPARAFVFCFYVVLMWVHGTCLLYLTNFFVRAVLFFPFFTVLL